MKPLTRPLTIIDVETTGLDVQKDAIISFASKTIYPGAHPPDDFYALIKPWKEIPPEVAELTHISDQFIAMNAPPQFDKVAQQIFGILTLGDLAGFNVLNFDIPILWEELYRCGITWDLSQTHVVDAGVIFKLKEPRDLTAALRFYLNEDHADAHSAMADVEATRKVIGSQWNSGPMYAAKPGDYSDLLQMDVAQLSEYCRTQKDGSRRLDLAGTIVIDKAGIYRYTHKKVRNVAMVDDPGYAQWMLRNDFSENTKAVLRKCLAEIFCAPREPAKPVEHGLPF